MSKDSKSKTLFVAFILAMGCSILVSAAAVILRPIQDANRVNDRNKNILIAAGLYDAEISIEHQFEGIDAKMVDVKTGEFVSGNVDAYFKDFKELTANTKTSHAIPSKKDIAGIRRISNEIPVYLVMENGQIETYVVPVYGQGLWSTLYGFLAVKSDGNTVSGLTFYEHAETPGLGGEVDNPMWKKKWIGKKLINDKGELTIQVVKGVVEKDDVNAVYKIDGLSGATLTSRGVDHLIRFWVDKDGFGPFLDKIRVQSQTMDKGE